MEISDLIPKEIVSDFGVKGFIDRNIDSCVEKLASYSGEESNASLCFICGLIQIGSDTKSFENSVRKYSPIVGSPVVSNIAPYVLKYIQEVASKRGYPLEKIAFSIK